MKFGRLFLESGERSDALDMLKRAGEYAKRMDSVDGLDAAVKRFQHFKQEARSKAGALGREFYTSGNETGRCLYTGIAS